MAPGLTRRAIARAQRTTADACCLYDLQLSGAGWQTGIVHHDDVITLFHEFGHGLHLLLTEVGTLGISGFGHVDGTSWAAQPVHGELLLGVGRALAHDAARRNRGTPAAPCSTRCWRRRTSRAGLGTLRQMEFALFDMRLHAENMPVDRASCSNCSAKVRAEVAVMQPRQRIAHAVVVWPHLRRRVRGRLLQLQMGEVSPPTPTAVLRKKACCRRWLAARSVGRCSAAVEAAMR